jgi:hypothetical protein
MWKQSFFFFFFFVRNGIGTLKLLGKNYIVQSRNLVLILVFSGFVKKLMVNKLVLSSE